MPLIEPGSPAPSFSLRDQRDHSHSMSDFHGRPVVLFFYPQDDTPACTDEACHFRDHFSEFGKIKAAVLGISPDDEASHAAFADKHRLKFPLLADAGRDSSGAPVTCSDYGVWREKTLYGRRYVGLVRTTYLIDSEGVVRRRWDHVRVNGHVAAVMAALRDLQGLPPATARGRPAKKSARKPRTKARAGGAVNRRPTRRLSSDAAGARGKPRNLPRRKR